MLEPLPKSNKSTELLTKLKGLPAEPGVYFHKSASGEIIYVGKAAVLKNRVRHYFQNLKNRDPKTEALIEEIVDTDWMVVDSELEALFLEAELIKRYKPRYNILERDDKSNLYVRIDMQHEYPTVTTTRRPLDDGAKYFGPYLSPFALKRALKFLRRIFPYSTHDTLPKRGCLLYHIGLCPGPETGQLDSSTYKASLKQLIMYLRGERVRLLAQLERDMQQAAKKQDFEAAARLRNQVFALKGLKRQVVFSDREFMDVSKDHALNELVDLLGLPRLPRRIEGYDISHMSGTDTVASMVVFTNGISDKGAYRKFKMRIPGNDDFAHMREVMARRMSGTHDNWGKPDLLLIDGGKGQLGAALESLQAAGIDVPAVGLAKQFEQIIIKRAGASGRGSNVELQLVAMTKQHGVVIEDTEDFLAVQLPKSSNVVKLLMRIRDESHRFAVSYHTVLKRGRQTSSVLDEIPTIGPETKKKLLRTFGSYRGVVQAREWELAKVVGEKRAVIIRQYTRRDRKALPES